MVKRILVPVDFSPRSSAALAFALGLARQSHADVDVLHVLSPGPLASAFDAAKGRPRPHPSAGQVVDARDQMDALVSSMDHHGVHLRQKIAEGDAAAMIVKAAVDDGDDLIVIGPHARSGVVGLLLGSIAKRLLGFSPCPVVTVRVSPYA